MDRVNIRPPLTDDGPRLIRANRESRELHRPWVEPFLDDEGFSAWLARSGSDTTHGLVATETATGEPVGIINISNIVRGAFHSA